MYYYRSDLKVTHIEEYDFCDTFLECTWLKLSLENVKLIYYGLLYRPPNGNVPSFLDKIESICLELKAARNCEINLIRDTNIDVSKCRDAKTKAYLDCIRRMGFSQLIDSPTHEDTRGSFKAILDHFATTDTSLYAQHGVLTVSATDHLPIFASRKNFKESHEKDEIYGRAYSRLKPEAFIAQVTSTEWIDVLNEMDPDLAWSIFKKKYIKILDKHAPFKFFQTRKDKKPWVTTEFLENANERDNLSRMAKSRGDPVL